MRGRVSGALAVTRAIGRFIIYIYIYLTDNLIGKIFEGEYI